MIKGYQAELMDMYEKTRTEENRKLAKRREEIKNKYPEILELDTTIQKLCLNLSMAALKGIGKRETKEKIQELLELVSLTDVRKKKISKLSGGMKRRVGIAQALLNEPKVLILDEPTSGLDPGERMRFRNLLSEFGRNRIVLISTHIVSDVEYIATCNAVMKNGKIAAVGETEELVKEVEGKVWNVVLDMAEVMTYETKIPVVNIYNREDGKTVLRYLAERPVIPGSEPADARMEDLYLWMFPEQGREEVR